MVLSSWRWHRGATINISFPISSISFDIRSNVLSCGGGWCTLWQRHQRWQIFACPQASFRQPWSTFSDFEVRSGLLRAIYCWESSSYVLVWLSICRRWFVKCSKIVPMLRFPGKNPLCASPSEQNPRFQDWLLSLSCQASPLVGLTKRRSSLTTTKWEVGGITITTTISITKRTLRIHRRLALSA